MYRARRPFHPGRLYDDFFQPYFMMRYEEPEGHVEKLQKEAAKKQPKRIKFMGELLRSKGFVWIATTNSIMGGLQQAGNILRYGFASTLKNSNNPMQFLYLFRRKP